MNTILMLNVSVYVCRVGTFTPNMPKIYDLIFLNVYSSTSVPLFVA